MSLYSTKGSVILNLHKIPTLTYKNDSIKDNIDNYQKIGDIINIGLIPDKEEEDWDEDDKKMKKSSNVNVKNQKINFKFDTLSRKYRSKIIKDIKKK